jgi:hypothetical protein
LGDWSKRRRSCASRALRQKRAVGRAFHTFRVEPAPVLTFRQIGSIYP